MSAYCDLVQQANAPEVDGGSLIVRHPHGVVAVCAPWNYPVEEIVLLCVPALIAGNSVVVKPSEAGDLCGNQRRVDGVKFAFHAGGSGSAPRGRAAGVAAGRGDVRRGRGAARGPWGLVCLIMCDVRSCLILVSLTGR